MFPTIMPSPEATPPAGAATVMTSPSKYMSSRSESFRGLDADHGDACRGAGDLAVQVAQRRRHLGVAGIGARLPSYSTVRMP